MKPYLLALGAGLVVGIIYSLLNVRSPAPPVVALVGLLGILAGEQIVPITKRLFAAEGLSLGWLKSECGEHIFGTLPVRPDKDAEHEPGRRLS
ncbi:XapX domain-containing protein [Bosea sp. (in: a-proteobacteria)]|uniref:XapX domain-containing protein n=1 Tax=Bosea sp. (in: a-proteobacteria) TaxID=1871050 RepID=UPI002734B129|nr:XapX domain-containing protein [Bosea sp. (in: a-proteobacteria)]MDP3254531.1 XapX domain-containing protein [Bosea sp. (in: a-proteobacteria)]